MNFDELFYSDSFAQVLCCSWGLNNSKLVCTCPLLRRAGSTFFSKGKPNPSSVPGQGYGYISSPLLRKRELHPHLSSSLLLRPSTCCLLQALELIRSLHELTQLAKRAETSNTEMWLIPSTLPWLSKSPAKARKEGMRQGSKEEQGRRARPAKHSRWCVCGQASITHPET